MEDGWFGREDGLEVDEWREMEDGGLGDEGF